MFEALNNIGGLKQNLLVILNDNKMSICPRVGGVASYLDRLRTQPVLPGPQERSRPRCSNNVPLLGDPVERFLAQLKEGVKAGLHGGMLFEDLGFRYLGPIDGHNLAGPAQIPADGEGPRRARSCCTSSPRRGTASARGRTTRSSSTRRRRSTQENGQRGAEEVRRLSRPTRTSSATRSATQMRTNPRVTVLTAAMCQGNKLEKVRDEFPDRFFDTGICESHAVAFAAGQAKAGLRPIVDIYSTFLQRSYDQIFQEVALQNLPVVFTLDRAGLTGPDGPTHHGAFDIAYMRLLPEHGRAWPPATPATSPPMLDFALDAHRPRVASAIRRRTPNAIAAASARRSNSARPKSSAGAATA